MKFSSWTPNVNVNFSLHYGGSNRLMQTVWWRHWARISFRRKHSLTKAVQAPRPKSPPLFLLLEIPNRDVRNDNGLTLESWGRQGQKFSLSTATKDQFYPCSQLINSQTQGDLKQDNVTCWVTLSPTWQQSISQSRQKPECIKVHLQKHWVSKVPHHQIP